MIFIDVSPFTRGFGVISDIPIFATSRLLDKLAAHVWPSAKGDMPFSERVQFLLAGFLTFYTMVVEATGKELLDQDGAGIDFGGIFEQNSMPEVRAVRITTDVGPAVILDLIPENAQTKVTQVFEVEIDPTKIGAPHNGRTIDHPAVVGFRQLTVIRQKGPIQ